jgi:uncharacterized cupin superfamily protein
MARPLTRATVADAVMTPSPIDPTWILEGAPAARTASVGHSVDGLTWVDVWDCTAGRFEWRYPSDETVHIVEGGAHVVDADGGEWELGPGDVVTFRKGTRARWHVPEYVRKVAFCRRDVPRWMAFYCRARRAAGIRAGRLAARARRGAAGAAPLVSLSLSTLV